MIFLDNASTTPMFEKGIDIYKEYACHFFFNPSAGYKESIEVAKKLNEVRKLILNKLNVDKGDIIFTGGATESNNLAIMGSKRNGKWEYIFSEGEHPSVYNVAVELKRQGFIVHFVSLQKNGEVDYNQLQNLLNEKTRLISVMHISNETGAINNIHEILKLRNKLAPNALLHVDGVQAFCKINISLDKLGVDFYTISAHKFHGPKGVGALYVKNINTIKSIVFGGGQENGYRSGTENVAGIMAMGYAIDTINIEENYKKVQKLKERMIEILSDNPYIHYNKIEGSPYILSVWFEDVNGETLMRALDEQGVIVGKGSACSTKKAGNRILESMGYNKDEIKSHLRLSFSETLTIEDIDMAGSIIKKVYNYIREKVL